MKKRPDVLWAFWANQNGPFFRKPRRVVRSDVGLWWDSTGDNSVPGDGLNHSDYYLSYASESKAEVELFALGFNAARRIVAAFTAGLTKEK